MRAYLLVGLCACRFGFDPRQAPADASGDAAIDAGDAGLLATITFGERPTSQRSGVTRDVTLDQTNPTANFGRAEDLSLAEFIANGEHALLRFDLASIAPGTPIVAARLSLTRLDYGDETPGPVEIHLVGESWIEGTNNGTPGTGASWTTRDGTTGWMTPGGTTSRLLATITPAAPEVAITLDTGVVQGWVDDAATNHGLLLTTGVITAHYHMHARDSALAGSTARPELALDLVQ